ncbi:MAG TPA: L,D-transpeptidase family protein [Polyangiales bacterium]
MCTQLAREHGQRTLHLAYVKSEHALCLLGPNGVVFAASASHGRAAGKKQFEGDQRTPEGRYVVSPARPSARFGLFLAVSYPNAADVLAAERAGVRPGGSIGVHGPQPWYAFLGSAQSLVDHSDGCIVTDRRAIEQLALVLMEPTPFDIWAELPTRAAPPP